jgi:hypothetical protein
MTVTQLYILLPFFLTDSKDLVYLQCRERAESSCWSVLKQDECLFIYEVKMGREHNLNTQNQLVSYNFELINPSLWLLMNYSRNLG